MLAGASGHVRHAGEDLQSRSRVAGTLWPDSPESKALGNLRTGIWRITQTAPGMVVVTGGAIDLAPDVTVEVRVLVDFSSPRPASEGLRRLPATTRASAHRHPF